MIPTSVVHYDGSGSFDAWMKKNLPSKVPDGTQWVYIENPLAPSTSLGFIAFDETAYDDVLKPLALTKTPSNARLEAATKSILAAAREQCVTSGKWMLFVPGEEVDAAWSTIAKATFEGSLGCGAKIRPRQAGRTSVCCVYVDDFDDRRTISRVLGSLEDFGFHVTCGFKPDVYTYLKIDTNNPWGLKPTLYSVGQVKSWDDEDRLDAILDHLGFPAAP